MKHRHWTILLCALAALPFSARAEEVEPDEPARVNDPIRYTFPRESDAQSLVEFCLELEYAEPETDADAELHEKRAPRAIKRACRRILELEDDKESPCARFARRELLGFQLEPSVDFASAKTDTLLEKFRAFLDSPSVADDDAELALMLADFLGDHPSPRAIHWSEKIGALLAPNANPELAHAGRILQGTTRRLALIGKPLELKGTALNGKAFDLAALKGKVALVFFWSTACDSCLDEIDNLKANYAGYREKGFEVVGICADDDRAAVAEFVGTERMPWITLFEGRTRHPAFDTYGINSLPATMLIGADGGVKALNVRDEMLGEKLRALLGPPAAGKQEEHSVVTPNPNARKPEEPHVKNAKKPKDAEGAESAADKLRERYTF